MNAAGGDVHVFARLSGMLDLPRWLSAVILRGAGCVILARGSRFESPSMQCRKRNHALRKVHPCTCASPSMEVAEWNHASSRVHGSVSALPSIETSFNFLTWIWRQRQSRRQCLGGVRNALGGRLAERGGRGRKRGGRIRKRGGRKNICSMTDGKTLHKEMKTLHDRWRNAP